MTPCRWGPCQTLPSIDPLYTRACVCRSPQHHPYQNGPTRSSPHPFLRRFRPLSTTTLNLPNIPRLERTRNLDLLVPASLSSPHFLATSTVLEIPDLCNLQFPPDAIHGNLLSACLVNMSFPSVPSGPSWTSLWFSLVCVLAISLQFRRGRTSSGLL